MMFKYDEHQRFYKMNMEETDVQRRWASKFLIVLSQCHARLPIMNIEKFSSTLKSETIDNIEKKIISFHSSFQSTERIGKFC